MERYTRKSYWDEAARHAKRALLGRRTLQLFGRSYRVAYEARHYAGNDIRDLEVIRLCASGRRCVFDVGANMGITVLVIAGVADVNASIHAFEASEATSLIIRENVLLNAIGNVSIVNALLGERSGSVAGFHWDFASGAASAMHAPPSGSSVLVEKVTMALDDYVAQRDARPDFVKVDVEGAEVTVLKGFQQTLARIRPEVFVEVHAWPKHPLRQNLHHLLELCRATRYRLLHLASKTTIDDVTRFSDNPPQALDAQARVLMLPTENRDPDWLRDYDTTHL